MSNSTFLDPSHVTEQKVAATFQRNKKSSTFLAPEEQKVAAPFPWNKKSSLFFK